MQPLGQGAPLERHALTKFHTRPTIQPIKLDNFWIHLYHVAASLIIPAAMAQKRSEVGPAAILDFHHAGR